MDKYVIANAQFSKFSKNYMELKKDLPIRPSEMGVLNIITETRHPQTSVQLAELLGVSKPMITTHLSVLLEEGYITKQQSKEDKRVFYVIPTEKARGLVAHEKEKQQRLLEQLIEKIGEDEFHHLLGLVEEANVFLENNLKENNKEDI